MAFLERLPSMCETLGSILSISKKKRERDWESFSSSFCFTEDYSLYFSFIEDYNL